MSSLVVIPEEPAIIPPQLPDWEFLRGGVMQIHVAPEPRWKLVHRNIRALHGLVTAHLGVAHTPMAPRFALMPFPSGIGWSVYVPDDSIALRVAQKVTPRDLFRRPSIVRMSALRRVPAPKRRAGVTTCIVRTITPVSVRWSGKGADMPNGISKRERRGARRFADISSLMATVATWLPERCGLEWGPEKKLGLQGFVVLNRTHAEPVPIGGKLGTVYGFSGEFVMRCCPATRWLLDAAQTVGLGGRTAYGFGRVIVEDV